MLLLQLILPLLDCLKLLYKHGVTRDVAGGRKQRQRARDLFDAVRTRSDFPLTLEAAREVLYDQFDLPGLVHLLQQIEEGAVRVVTVDVDMLLYGFGLPLYAALVLAAREPGLARRMAVGYAVLVPVVAWGVLAAIGLALLLRRTLRRRGA